MALRIILIVLIINSIAVFFIILSNRTRREKVVWSTILLAIPLALWAIYRMLLGSRKGPGDLKEWESK
ncbi:MAG: hypothetical protein HQL21_06135 [Candidatus Omnitrophica bacterium]|nr:hypothetical protein [Candidatus Omnitrophota bacterium]